MKVLVSGDEYCYKCGNKYYLTGRGTLFAKRYLAVFDEIRFAFRMKKVKECDLPKGAQVVTDIRIELADIPFFQGPKQMLQVLPRLMSSAKSATRGIDCAVLRLPSTTAFAVWRYINSNKIPYVTELVFDCYDAYTSSESIFERMIWKIMHNLQKRACLKAEGVACVTRDYLQQHYPASKRAFTSNYSSIELPIEFLHRARKYPTNHVMTIAHVATQVEFNGRKGHNEIIKAISQIKAKGYNVNAVFIGESYNDGIKKLTSYAHELGVGEFIRFTGLLNSSQMRQELIDADLAVLPTKAEGLPRVVIEAMAVGLPCITTPVSGNPELIDKEWLVKYINVELLANKIIELISSPEKYEAQSKINFKRSREYCNDILNERRNKFYRLLKDKASKI